VDDERAILGKKDIATNKDIPNLTFETFSPASIIMDMIDVTSVALPKAFVLCVAVCLLLIAVWFRSLLVPLKLILTVVVPLTWTYGAALYVYEDGVLAWTGLVELSPLGNQGMDWSVPVFTLTFLVGLAMDYEIFLIERVMEFREESFGDKESIQLGVAATGETITCAGLIMAFTFSAEMLGSVPVTNQMGFILIFSILVDTFVVRTVLVPAYCQLEPPGTTGQGKCLMYNMRGLEVAAVLDMVLVRKLTATTRTATSAALCHRLCRQACTPHVTRHCALQSFWRAYALN